MNLRRFRPLLKAVGENDTRLALRCVCLRGNYALATNGRLAARLRLNRVGDDEGVRFPVDVKIPAERIRMMLEIEKALDPYGCRNVDCGVAEFVEPGELGAVEGQVKLECGPVTVVDPALDEAEWGGNFPKFDPILTPARKQRRVRVAFSWLVLMRLAKLARDYEKHTDSGAGSGVVFEIPIDGDVAPVLWRLATLETVDQEPEMDGAIQPMRDMGKILEAE